MADNKKNDLYRKLANLDTEANISSRSWSNKRAFYERYSKIDFKRVASALGHEYSVLYEQNHSFFSCFLNNINFMDSSGRPISEELLFLSLVDLSRFFEKFDMTEIHHHFKSITYYYSDTITQGSHAGGMFISKGFDSIDSLLNFLYWRSEHIILSTYENRMLLQKYNIDLSFGEIDCMSNKLKCKIRNLGDEVKLLFEKMKSELKKLNSLKQAVENIRRSPTAPTKDDTRMLFALSNFMDTTNSEEERLDKFYSSKQDIDYPNLQMTKIGKRFIKTPSLHIALLIKSKLEESDSLTSRSCSIHISVPHYLKNLANENMSKENVLIHELAHLVDNEYSIDTAYSFWNLKYTSIKDGADFKLNKYGRTNISEFIAVSCEAFFSNPIFLKEHHPDIFQEFLDFFETNPTALPKLPLEIIENVMSRATGVHIA